MDASSTGVLLQWFDSTGWHCVNTDALVSSCFFMFIVPFRTSACSARVAVSPLRGIAITQFKNGHTYSYKRVSRRAIINLMLNKSMSLGFWVNRNLVQSERAICTVRPVRN
jgi:hypothetical protein